MSGRERSKTKRGDDDEKKALDYLLVSFSPTNSPNSSSSSSSSERTLSTASVLDEALATAAPLSLEDDEEVFLRTLPAAAERRSGATAADARPAGAAARQETALREVALVLMAVAFMALR